MIYVLYIPLDDHFVCGLIPKNKIYLDLDFGWRVWNMKKRVDEYLNWRDGDGDCDLIHY
jgi:hypothetical protein